VALVLVATTRDLSEEQTGPKRARRAGFRRLGVSTCWRRCSHPAGVETQLALIQDVPGSRQEAPGAFRYPPRASGFSTPRGTKPHRTRVLRWPRWPHVSEFSRFDHKRSSKRLLRQQDRARKLEIRQCWSAYRLISIQSAVRKTGAGWMELASRLRTIWQFSTCGGWRPSLLIG